MPVADISGLHCWPWGAGIYFGPAPAVRRLVVAWYLRSNPLSAKDIDQKWYAATVNATYIEGSSNRGTISLFLNTILGPA